MAARQKAWKGGGGALGLGRHPREESYSQVTWDHLVAAHTHDRCVVPASHSPIQEDLGACR
jgi:hypothetical protein